MNLRPLGNRVVVELLEAEEVSLGGILIPETAQEKPNKGKVIAIGSGLKDDKGNILPMDVTVGDIVLLQKYGNVEVKVENKKLLIAKETDILAIIEG